MPRRNIRAESADSAELQAGLAKIAEELDVEAEFPDVVVEAAADAAAQRPPDDRSDDRPDDRTVDRTDDRTDVGFVTLDPEGSMDLDQALQIERCGDGFLVRYAIADVAAFVAPGGPVDAEAHRRGETLYGPDRRIPLHPPVLSEGAASLLPGQVRPALLWSLELDAAGELRSTDVRRARVKSHAQLDYVGAQRQLDDQSAPEQLMLLREVGTLREELERTRGGVSLALPEQEIVVKPEGWSLVYRAQSRLEQWNAQISLLTGMAAAKLMLDAKVGLLRTLPPPDPRAVARLRRTATALRIGWPEGLGYPEFIRGLDPGVPAQAAMLNSCTSLLGGAGYAAFDGDVPQQPMHSAIASPYAHATAPLRRLADRYVGEVCVALCAGSAIPDWARRALPELPKTMADADRRAHRYESAVLSLVEAGVLKPMVGQELSGVITDVDDQDPSRGVVMVQEPAVEGRVTGPAPLPLGHEVSVRLVEADVATRSIRFQLGSG